MATSVKRVNLSLRPEDYEVIKAFAEQTGTTPTSVINNLVVELVPTLKNVVELYQLANTKLSDSKSDIQSLALNSINDLSGATLDLTKKIDETQMGMFDDGDD